MFRKAKIFLAVLAIVATASVPVHALDWNDKVYNYFSDQYDAQSNLEPVASSYYHERGNSSFGYVDKEGNIKIPIHDNWNNASKFSNGMAVVYDKNLKTCLAIDTKGNTIFEFEPNTYDGETGSGPDFLQVLDNDPNGMFCAYVTGFGDSVFVPSNPTITFYDRQGNHNTLSLSYGSITKFENGVATLSKLTNVMGSGGGDMYLSFTECSYTPVATIDTRGVITDIVKPVSVQSSERLGGDNRYETSVAISEKGWTQSDNVVLANGEIHSDALVGSSFAYLKDAPVLITPPDKLDDNISKEIERLKVKTVYILGNDTSISEDVENDLKKKYTVVRIGGDQVLNTAVKVGDEVRKIKQFDSVTLINGQDYPDALAMSPFSAKKTMPILFTDKDSLREDTLQALKSWGIKNVIIAGGTGVVSEQVEKQLQALGINITRLAGQDRYATALEILKYFRPDDGYKDIAIASGENFADALTGAVLSAKLDIPLVIVSHAGASEGTINYLSEDPINEAYIFGGSAVVDKGVVTK